MFSGRLGFALRTAADARILAFAWVLPITLLAAPARAQTPSDPKAESEAGQRLFHEKVYEAALRRYTRAYELGHAPADLEKVAECYRELGELGLAYETYAKLAATHAAQLGSRGTGVTAAIAELAQRTGTLTVRTPIAGATVTVGERIVGTTPLLAPVRLPSGPGHLSITKEGFEPFLADFTVDPSHPATVDATLTPRVVTGHLSVREVHGVSAHVIVDGKDVGATPWEGDLEAGLHQVALVAEAVRAEPQTVLLRHGARAESVFNGVITTGHLHVDTNPLTATIEVDGKAVATGHLDADLPIGPHTIHVTEKDFRPATQSVIVLAGANQTNGITLEPAELAPEALAARRKAEDAEAIRGGYGAISGFIAYTANAQNVSCAGLAGSPSCSNGFPLAGGFSVRGGYSLGLIGFELVGAFLADGHTDTIHYPGSPASTVTAPTSAADVDHHESYTYSSLGGMLAAGPRFATPGRSFRFTAGAAGGVALRSYQFSRNLSAGLVEMPSQSFSATLASPGILADAGLVMGATPGASFTVGAMLWADFPTTQTTLPVTTVGTAKTASFPVQVPSYTVVHGGSVYIGPYLGIRFGH